MTVSTFQQTDLKTQAGNVDADLTDERSLNTLGLGALALKATVATGDIDNNAVTAAKIAAPAAQA